MKPYEVEEIILENAIKLKLLAFIRIYLVVNVSQVVKYKKQVERQKVKKVKLIKVEEVKEQKVKKILNKRKVREVMKYLV